MTDDRSLFAEMNVRRFFALFLILTFVGCLSLALVHAADAPAPNAATPPQRIKYLDFREANLLDVLLELGKMYKVGMVPDSNVTGKVTLTLQDVTLEDALKLIVEQNGCTYQKRQGNVYFISKATPAPPPAPVGKLVVTYKDNLLDIEAENVDVLQLLQKIKDVTGLNVAPTPQVTGKISPLQVRGIRVEPDLRYLLAAQGFSFERYGSIYIVEKTATATQPAGPAAILSGVEVDDDRRVTLHVDNKPLKDVLETLRRRLNIDLILAGNVGAENVTVHLTKVTLSEALTAMLRGTKVWFKKIDRSNLEEVRALLGRDMEEMGKSGNGDVKGQEDSPSPTPNPQPPTLRSEGARHLHYRRHHTRLACRAAADQDGGHLCQLHEGGRTGAIAVVVGR
jgi:type II secretory pathway component HofQ